MPIPSPTERQARILWISVTALAVAVLVLLIGLVAWGLGWVLDKLAPVLLPLAIAGIIAYLLDPLVDLFARKMPRTTAILLVFFLGVLLVTGLAATVVPRLVVETRALIHRIPEYAQRAEEKFENWIEHSPWARDIKIPFLPDRSPPAPESPPAAPGDEPKLSEQIFSRVAEVLPEIGSWVLQQLRRVASWFGWLVGLLLIPIYTFYLLREKADIKRSWTDYLPVGESRAKEEIIFVISAINDSLIVFFRGQVLVALCSGALLTIGFFALGLNYALVLGVMAGLLGIIPYLGVMLALVPSVTLAAVQFGDWLHPVLVLLMFAIVNALEGLVISPKIIGDRMALHPLTVIIAVMVGTTLMGGIIGGVLAIPLTAALKAIMFRYVWQRRTAAATAKT